ncbi:MAG: GLPGLI family protein [Bacteroidales bacterium]|nr:GLPGLI family protein [Bacteroidales bacterium]
MTYIRFIFLCIFAVICSFPSLSQQPDPQKAIDYSRLEIVYKLTYQQDSTDLNDLRMEYMILLIGNNKSIFLSYNNMQWDKRYREAVERNQVQELFSSQDRPPASRFRYRIYKNFPDGKITTVDHLPGNHFLYEEYMDQFNWKVTGQRKSILGFAAQKATTYYGGREWVAWFTTDIQLREGPYKFHGLPGLILNISDTKNHYVFEIESIQKTEPSRPINFIQRHYINTERAKFLRAKKNFRNEIINRAYSGDNPTQTQITAASNILPRNNPIELKAD